MAKAKVIKLHQSSCTPPLPVTQPYLPSADKYMHYVAKAFDNKWITNGGPLLTELTDRLKEYLGVKHLLLVNNGTSALQLAYHIKGLKNKTVATTPFTFPATLTALTWADANVHLSDIQKDSWNLSAKAVLDDMETQDIDAIVPVNIFGVPCELEEFDQIGQAHNIPIIYDSAQSLLTKYKGKSIFDYGDIHCISFHATKLFHTCEGGALVFKNKEDLERAERLINFGIQAQGEVHDPGINAKMSELHAAMGLCTLDDLPMLIENRQQSVERYQKLLANIVEFQSTPYDCDVPPMYMPVKFESVNELEAVERNLAENGYMARRYFYPGNHKFMTQKHCELPNNRITTEKILCLPLMHNLTKQHVHSIAKIISSSLKR
jgi:dTDP-4-amino-4,6-dideoxygalactose transaminase